MNVLRLAAAFLLLGAACQTPAPRLPFPTDSSWHGSAKAGEWLVNKSFVEDTTMYGLEYVVDSPGSGGWAWVFGVRYASGEGDSSQTVYKPNSTFPLGKNDLTVNVDSEIETQFYELDVGVRQVYRGDSRLQTFFGIGVSVLYSQSEETFVQPAITTVPPVGETNPYPVDTPLRDHERSEYRPGIYANVGLIWNLLRDQVVEGTEFPIALDVRGLLSVDYSYLEVSVSFGFGK